jgi:thiamine biosynthesis lipoprotein
MGAACLLPLFIYRLIQHRKIYGLIYCPVLKRGFVITLCLVLTLSGCGQTAAKEKTRYQAEFLDLFDTMTQIVGYSDDKDLFSEQVNYVYDNLKEMHQLYDIYNDYDGINNIKTINDNAGKASVKVDQKIIDLLKFSKEVYNFSGGEVNIAFGSVLSIWHKYREAGTNNPDRADLPPMADLEAANKHINIDNMIIDEKNSTVYLSDPEMRLDVGAIAKGYATERVAKMLEAKWPGLSILLSVGGNVKAIGMKETGTQTIPWNVGITDPNDQSAMLMTLNVSDMSMVTSGDYQRYYIVNGKAYNHIVDPKTLYPATHCRAVTIVVADSGLADGLSTAAFIMPLAQAKELIQSKGAEAVFVMNDGSLEYTSGFKAFILKME